jgi:hypothetical protein
MMGDKKHDTKTEGRINPRGFGTEVKDKKGSLLKRVTPKPPKPGERFGEQGKTR